MARTPEENAVYMREYRAKRSASGVPVKKRDSWVDNQRSRYRRYGLTEESYFALYNGQGGKCAICREPIKAENTQGDRSYNTHIDHCHTTGKVRGLLCSGCNLGLGHFKDSADKLRAAIEYLKP